jgi:hypothetical protein
VIAGGLNLAWEVAQLPLYTISTASPSEIVFAIVHCTLGDVLITAGSLLLALLLIRRPVYRGRLNVGPMAGVAVLLGTA